MNAPRVLGAFSFVVALAASLGVAGCTTNNYNCNVKDACRVPGASPDH